MGGKKRIVQGVVLEPRGIGAIQRIALGHRIGRADVAPHPVMAVDNAGAEREVRRQVRAESRARFATVNPIVRNLLRLLEQREILRLVPQLAECEEARTEPEWLVELRLDAGL